MKGSQTWYQANEDYNTNVENILDTAVYGPDWLKIDKLAKMVAESFKHHDGLSFKLVCYTIMSNHIHFIAYKFRKPVYVVINSLKTYTAKECNKLLGRTGSFWHENIMTR